MWYNSLCVRGDYWLISPDCKSGPQRGVVGSIPTSRTYARVTQWLEFMWRYKMNKCLECGKELKGKWQKNFVPEVVRLLITIN